MRLAARPARGGYTYGLKRAEILSAQANGLTLLILAAWLAYEAIRRLITPPHVAGAVVLITAIAGVAVKVAAAWCTSKASRVRRTLEQFLSRDHAITHTTIQADHADGPVLTAEAHREPGAHCEDPHGVTHTSRPHPH